MTDLRLRPLFRLHVPCEMDRLLTVLKRRCESGKDGIRGVVYHTSCVLKVPADQMHYWSPQLQLSIDPAPEGGTIVHGLYGPRPAVWSLFIALYVGVGFLGVMGIIFGYSQDQLGEAALAYWSGPVALVLCAVIWIVARQGRRIGYDQMVSLRTFFNEVVAECEGPGD